MGSVYSATDERTGARVAVKVLHAEALKDVSTQNDKSKLTRFQREAKAASAILSEHVARVLDWGNDEESQQPYMVMELLDGEDLQQVLKRVDVLPPDVALRVAAQACDGLLKAHEARVTHRDIKPANLFLARAPTGEVVVKILDFGIAKIRPESEAASETTGLTRTGSMLGSPRYMSPEQARGNRSLDHRTDVWSLGVVLYRMLTGHLPHENAEAVGDFIVMLCSEPPRSLRKYAPWVPEQVAAVVEGALQIDREKRYPTAEAMLLAIRALLPGGDALRADELVPVRASMRASAPPPPQDPALVSSNDATVPLSPAGRRAARKDDGPTPNTLANAQIVATQAPRRAAAPVAVAVAALALGILAVGVVRSMRGSETAGSGANSGAAATATGASSRRANLVIFPLDASVEVDGAAVAAQDGVVELNGALGSVHRVRLSKNGQEKVAEVVLGEAGAEPPKVELLVAAQPSATASAPVASGGPAVSPGGRPGAPGTKKTAAPGTSSAPTTSKNPLIPERFE
jgi:serine/threonine-protein kinase